MICLRQGWGTAAIGNRGWMTPLILCDGLRAETDEVKADMPHRDSTHSGKYTTDTAAREA
jgi:hypothetical protein